MSYTVKQFIEDNNLDREEINRYKQCMLEGIRL